MKKSYSNIEKNTALLLKPSKAFRLLLMVLFVCSFANVANAQKTWDGGAGTSNWGDGNNWNPNGVPTATDDVVINTNVAILVNTTTTTINSLTISGSAAVSFTSSGGGRTITIDNTNSSIGTGSTLTLQGSTGSGTRSMTIAYTGASRTMSVAGTLVLTNVGDGTNYNANNSITTVTGIIINNEDTGVINSTVTNLNFASGGTYIHELDGGTIPTATWSSTSNCNITGLTTNQPSGDGQAFGNLSYNCSGMSGNINMAGSGLSIAGNFQVINVGTGQLRMSQTSLTVSGNCTINGYFRIATSTLRTLNVIGDFSLTGGSLDMSAGTNASHIGTLNVTGNFTHTGGTINESGSGSGAIFFNKAGTQTFTSGGTVSNTINYTVNSGSTLQMAAPTTVVTGNSFVLSSGATLGITSAAGITSSGATGNIQTTTRTFNTGASYIYNDSSSQAVGNGLPATVNNLTLSGSGTKTFSIATTIAGTLSIASGVVANLGTGLTHTANSLTLGGTGTALGSWGSTTSSATNQDNTYFSATTGIVNVSTANGCNAPVTVIPNKVDKCSTSNNGSITPTFTGGLANVRYIKLTQKYNNSFHLTEIQAFEVFTGTNVARSSVGAVASASSDYGGGYPASNTIDNITTYSGTPYNIWHSDGTLNEWIQIDLQSAKNLDYLRIYNRSDCCQLRAQNILLELFDGSNNLIYCKTINVYEGVNGSHSIDVNILDLSWTPAYTTSLNRTGLGAGTYTLNYADGTGYAVSTPITIVVADPTITTATTPAVVTPVCQSASAQTTTMAYTATTNNPTSYSIDWTGLVDQVSTPFAFVAGAGSVTGITVPAGTASGTYTGTMTITTANGCTVTKTVTLTVNIAPAITTQPSTPTATCSGSGTQSMTVVATGTGLTYDWQLGGVSVVNGGVISGQGTATLTLTSPIATNAGSYTVVVSGTCTPSVTSTARTVTVNTAPAITTQPSTPTATCSGSGTQSMTVVATGTGLTYDWQLGGISVVNDGVISGQGTATLTLTNPIVTNAGSYTVVVSGTCTSAVTSTARTVTVNPLPNNVSNGFSATTMCAGDIPQLTFDAVDATFTTPYSITYKNNANATIHTQSISTASPFSFTPADNPTANAGYTLISISNATCTNATIASFGDSGANLIVRPIPVATISGTTTVCVGSPSPNIIFANPQSVAILVTYTINGGGNLTMVVASSGTSSIAVPTTGSGSFVYNLVDVAYSDAAPSCTNVISGSATVTVDSLSVAPTGITGTATICNGDSTTLTINGGTAGTGAVVQWFIGSCGGTAAGTGNSITVSPTSNTTYYVQYSGTCNTTACVSTTVTVNPLQATPIVGTITHPTCVISSGSVDLSGLPFPGTLYQTGTATNTYSTTGATMPISGLAPGTYNFYSYNGTCPSPLSINVVITPSDTKTWNGTAWSPSAPSAADTAIINGNYSASSDGDLNVCSLIINTGYKLDIEYDQFLIIQNNLTVDGTLNVLDKGSLVMVNDLGVISGSGITNVHRFTSTYKKNDYVYWSTPISTTPITSAVFPTWRTGYAYGYNNAWVGASTMTPAKGFIVMVPDTGSFSEIVFRGIVNNGVYKVGGIAVDKSYLLGNPYPSALDADQFIVQNAGVIRGTLYFWTHATAIQLASNIPGTAGSGVYAYTSDDYASYNLSGGVGTGVGTGNTNTDPSKIIVPTGKIASGQGFFTASKAVITGANEFVFNNSMRISSGAGSNSQFFKTKASKNNSKTVTIEKHRVWLNLSNTQGAFKQTLLGYIGGATNGDDPLFDGKTLNGNKFLDFYSVNQNKNLVIQGRALPFDEKDEVPLGYKTTIEGIFTINIDQTDGLLLNQAIFLEDKLTKTLFNLKTGKYTFSTAKGTFNDRFVLKYIDKTLGSEDFETQANKVLVSVKNKQIKINSFSEMIEKVVIYDISGKQIYQKDDLNTNELSVANLIAVDQVLIVKTTLQNGSITTDKIIF